MPDPAVADKPTSAMKGRRAVWLGVAVLVTVFAASALFLRQTAGRISLHLETPVVQAGGTLTLRQEYRHEWAASTLDRNLKVYDKSGNQIFVHSETLESRFGLKFPLTTRANTPERVEFGRQLLEVVQRHSGVMEVDVYNSAIQDAFFIEKVGCPIGLGLPANAKPPSASSEQQSFRVFPGTPAGEYRIVVDGEYYCGWGPTGELTFRVE